MIGRTNIWLSFLVGITWIMCAGSVARAQVNSGPAPSTNSDFNYLGSNNCQRCHFNPIPQDETDGRTLLLTMRESHKWLSEDRHSKAFTLLGCERGQAMGGRLGWNVTQDQRCLSCHADWHASRPNPGQNILAEGVACEACHGPASKYISEHSNASWRSKTLTQRSHEFGMVTLRDPQQRAKVCLSCHIGDASQGKVITHEMYAAGHPPLPGLELREFSESMKHWNDIPDQLARIDQERQTNGTVIGDYLKRIQTELGENAGTVPALKTVLYGGVMTLRQSVQLLADEAAGKIARTAQSADSPTWPEFAVFDCAMCHHDLRYPAWRQARLDRAPGRPQIPRWPQALVEIAIQQAAGSDEPAKTMTQEFNLLVEELDAPFLRQPFGDSAAIAQPATRLIAFLDGLLDRMKTLKYDRESAEIALRELCNAALSGTPDYESARQLAWAFQSIYKAIGSSNSFDAARKQTIERELEALRTELHLNLRSLQPDDASTCSQAIGDADLQAALRLAADYSPTLFQQHFRRIQAEIAP